MSSILRPLLVSSILLVIAGCFGGDEPTIAGRSDSSSPAAVSEAFLAYLSELAPGAEPELGAYFTGAALAAIESGQGSFEPEAMSGFSIGTTSLDGATARQQVTIEQDGSNQEFQLMLRHEPEGWRIHGMVMPFSGDAEWVIDFEQEGGPLGEVGEAIGEALAEGLEEAFTEGWDDMMAEQSANNAAEQIARYESLAADGDLDLQPGWSGEIVGGRRPASDVLEEILAGTGLSFDHGEFAERLAQSSRIELAGVSRIQALEALAAELSLTPDYEPAAPWGEELEHALAWIDGARTEPVAFAGPFAVFPASVVENAPHTTGELTIAAYALGLPEATLAGNAHMFEVMRIDSIRGTGGAELFAELGTRFQTQPSQNGSLLGMDLTFELSGLLRGVESIEAVPGSLQLARTGEVFRTELFYGDAEVDLLGHTAQVTWTESGCQLSIGDAPELEAYELCVAAWAMNELPYELQGSSWYGWNGQLQGEAWFQGIPGKLGLCLYTTELQSFPFELPEIPLAHAAEQPEQRTELQVTGPAPLEVRFERDVPDTNPDFPEVDLVLASHCNKTILDAQVSFVYLDANGGELGDFPHTLTGEVTFEGTLPLLEPGAEAKHRTMAFFRPDDTASVRFRVETVAFVDGTTWSSEE